MALESKDILIKYLLGDLPEGDLERLAEEYFVDDDAWQALSAIENDLIDDYVRRQLPQSLHQSFESRFVNTPARRERVEFARVLMNSVVREQITADATQHHTPENSRSEQTPSPDWVRRPIVRLSLAVAGLLLAGITAVLMVQNARLRNELKSMQSTQGELQQRLKKAQEEAANRLRDPGGTAILPLSIVPTISILLSPGALRNSQSAPPTLRVLAGQQSVELLLDLEQDEYGEYDAIIKTADGQTVQHMTGLKSRTTQNNGKAVSLIISSQLLKKNDYVVNLFGRPTSAQVKAIDSYVFSVSHP